MNLENYFCASKAKFEPILLEFIASSFRGWGGGGWGVCQQRAPSHLLLFREL